MTIWSIISESVHRQQRMGLTIAGKGEGDEVSVLVVLDEDFD